MRGNVARLQETRWYRGDQYSWQQGRSCGAGTVEVFGLLFYPAFAALPHYNPRHGSQTLYRLR